MDTVRVTEGSPAATSPRDSTATTRDEIVDELSAHGPVLLATARLITLDHHEAQDLVQTTFEIAIRNADRLRDPGALRAWLLRVEVREAFRLVRRLRRLVALDGRVAEVAVAAPDLAERADVRAGLAKLPPRIRAAIALHHMAGLSVEDTARAMGVTENTVKSQLKTGLARLREDLGDG